MLQRSNSYGKLASLDSYQEFVVKYGILCRFVTSLGKFLKQGNEIGSISPHKTRIIKLELY